MKKTYERTAIFTGVGEVNSWFNYYKDQGLTITKMEMVNGIGKDEKVLMVTYTIESEED